MNTQKITDAATRSVDTFTGAVERLTAATRECTAAISALSALLPARTAASVDGIEAALGQALAPTQSISRTLDEIRIRLPTGQVARWGDHPDAALTLTMLPEAARTAPLAHEAATTDSGEHEQAETSTVGQTIKRLVGAGRKGTRKASTGAA